jgi:hypothetical protein
VAGGSHCPIRILFNTVTDATQAHAVSLEYELDGDIPLICLKLTHVVAQPGVDSARHQNV